MQRTKRIVSKSLARLGVVGTVLGVLLGACGDAGPTLPAHVAVSPSVALVDSVGAVTTYHATVTDQSGASMPGADVVWSTSDPSVVTVDAETGVAVAHGAGSAMIIATAAPASGSASFELFLPYRGAYQLGVTYFGREQYVEYVPGDLPVVLSAPHGGYLEPDEIPDRTWGTMAQDRNTQELARTLAATLEQHTGGRPHVVISRLHRVKLDPNREIVEAAQDNVFAEYAWGEFHAFIDSANARVARDHGRGFYIDLHGHGHEMQRLEWGYLLSANDLALSDAELNGGTHVNRSGIRTLALEADSSFAALLRGPTSLGGLLQARSYPSVPSPAYPDPGGLPYFTGGYNTQVHGGSDGGPVSGVQLEMNWTGVRDTEAMRASFAEAVARALEEYFALHYHVTLAAGTALSSAPLSDAKVAR